MTIKRQKCVFCSFFNYIWIHNYWVLFFTQGEGDSMLAAPEAGWRFVSTGGGQRGAYSGRLHWPSEGQRDSHSFHRWRRHKVCTLTSPVGTLYNKQSTRAINSIINAMHFYSWVYVSLCVVLFQRTGGPSDFTEAGRDVRKTNLPTFWLHLWR